MQMQVSKLREIAKRYGFVIAKNQNEVKVLEKRGYTKVNFDPNELMPELYQGIDYEKRNNA